MSKLDELFVRKLADHSIAPSPGAWENVEARLSKKNNTIIWMRWAAVFLFGSLLFSFLWMRNRETELPLAKETPVTPPTRNVEIKQEVIPIVNGNTGVSKAVHRKKKKEIRHDNPMVQPTLAVVQTPVVPEQINESSGEQKLNVLEEVKPGTSPKSIVLIYTLDPVALPQSENADIKVAATAERKDKSFRKMMRIANEVKNSDSPLDGIRNMKEDLFALDLKNKTTTKKH